MTFSRRFALLLAASLVLLITCQSVTAANKKKKKKKAQVENADDLQIVDCTLPGRVKRMGRLPAYIGKGRRVRTSAMDCQIRGGTYVQMDRSSYASSLQFWQPEADAGDPQAQSYVGEIYEKRQNPDYELAALWYRKAAKQGYARAQVNLATLYERGLGVAKDLDAAREWYGKAAGLPGDVVLDSIQQAKELQEELEQLRLRGESTEDELEAARQELEKAKRELEEARRSLTEAQSSTSDTPAEQVVQIVGRVEAREGEVTRRTAALEERERAWAELQRDLKAIEDKRRQVAPGPKIDILQPDVLATRGSVLVPLARHISKALIKGRALAPAGLRALTADDRPVAVDSAGFFDVTFARPAAQQEVTFEIIDEAGRKARRTLILQPVEVDSTRDSVSTPSRRGRRAPPLGFAPNGYHALIIGIAEYSDFEDLQTAERDAEELQTVLEERYGFSTNLVSNPSRLTIFRELDKLRDVMKPEQSLLIYYAGHGQIGPKGQRGYWIPSNARVDDPKTWILNEAITDYLDGIRAMHILVVSDSCYSGTLTRSGLTPLAAGGSRPDQRQGIWKAIPGKRSRTVLTSGGLQPVLDVGGGDNSLFAQAFLRALRINDGELSGNLLWSEVSFRMARGADRLGVEQVPEYAPISRSGHEAGDFVLRPVKIQQSVASLPSAR